MHRIRRREVEVEFETRWLSGFHDVVAVPIRCRRRCLDATFRQQWEPPLPVHGALAAEEELP